MKKKIAVLKGDGIGPEVTNQAIKALEAVATSYHHQFVFEEALIGAAAIDATGQPYPEATHQLCTSSDAILFGAIGHPRYDNDPTAKVRPEQGLLAMRKALGLFANIRPVKSYPLLEDASPLKNHIIHGTDFVVYRELTGGIYFGKPRGRSEDGQEAFDTLNYSREEIERIARLAFEAARKRRNKLTLVDKANVLATSRLWREIVKEMHQETYSDVTLDFMFVDNAAMQIIQQPTSFDVVLTGNMFGDILTDEASVIAGSVGLLPSASVGANVGLYEPIHGSYPQATGQDIANPLAAILSAALLLESSFSLVHEAEAIRKAVEQALTEGKVTRDLDKNSKWGTQAIGNFIAETIGKQ